MSKRYAGRIGHDRIRYRIVIRGKLDAYLERANTRARRAALED